MLTVLFQIVKAYINEKHACGRQPKAIRRKYVEIQIQIQMWYVADIINENQ